MGYRHSIVIIFGIKCNEHVNSKNNGSHILAALCGAQEETDPNLWDALWTGDYINYIVDIPLINDPGIRFNYSNLTSNWRGIIVARARGTDLKSFGWEHLFSPLGAELGDWNQDVDGYYIGSGDIQFTARDMAKFGLHYLNRDEY